MTKLSRVSAIVLGTAALSTAAHADIDINGFASVGGGWYNGSETGDSYLGYDQHFAADPVTKIGLQFSTAVNDKVTATGQLLAKGSNDYDVEAAWAYVSYAVNDEWDVRAGRLRAPLFAYSDFLDVGYAYPWITPPTLVYRLDFDSVEGVDTLYRTEHGDWSATYQLYYGRLTDDINIEGEELALDFENFAGINATFNKDWLTFKASFNRAKFTIESPTDLAALIDGGSGLRAGGYDQAADALEMKDEEGIFWGLGVLIDYDDWLFNTEYTSIVLDEQNLISEDKAWYAMIGKRLGDFTVHATYAVDEDDPDYSVLDEIPTADPRYALAEGAIGNADTSSISLGVRYDFAAATSFKAEVTRYDFDATDTDGTLVNFSIDTVF